MIDILDQHFGHSLGVRSRFTFFLYLLCSLYPDTRGQRKESYGQFGQIYSIKIVNFGITSRGSTLQVHLKFIIVLSFISHFSL